MNMNMHIRYAAGFTLISIMIVVAIIGILAAIAYPSYISQVRRARRSDAHAALLQVATREEQFYSEYNSYGSLEALGYTTPVYSQSQWYELAAEPLADDTNRLPSVDAIANDQTAQDYILTATPRNDQIHDTCGGFSLDSLGRQDITGGANTNTDAADCW